MKLRLSCRECYIYLLLYAIIIIYYVMNKETIDIRTILYMNEQIKFKQLFAHIVSIGQKEIR